MIAIAMAALATTSAHLLPRSIAPDFSNVNSVIDGSFKKVSLKDYAGKYVVLLFYPFDFTYVCPTELIAFSESMSRFSALDTAVLGISTDSHFTHLAWTKTVRTEGGVGKLNFPLLADISKQVSRDYGVLVTNPEDDLYGAALRGLYILDGNTKIRSVQINDAPVGRSVDETIRLI